MSEEQNYQAAFDQMEEPVEAVPQGLGKVQIGRSDEEFEELRQINKRMGYIPLLTNNLPSQGRFYRNDVQVSI
jgi:hypothetical protein